MADDPRAAAPELTEQVQQGLRRAIPETFRSTPFMSGLNISFDRYEPDDVVVRLPFSEALTNDGVVYHGGVIAAMIDTAGAAAAWSNHDFNRGTRAATVSMSLQYVGAARSSDLLCSARTIRRGRELVFTEITATDESGSVVAHAHQTYRIV